LAPPVHSFRLTRIGNGRRQDDIWDIQPICRGRYQSRGITDVLFEQDDQISGHTTNPALRILQQVSKSPDENTDPQREKGRQPPSQRGAEEDEEIASLSFKRSGLFGFKALDNDLCGAVQLFCKKLGISPINIGPAERQ
jgi:hypothetical protein